MFMPDDAVEVRDRRVRLFDFANETIEPLETFQFFRMPQLGGIQCPAQKRQRLVVCFQRYGKRMPVLAAQCKRKTCRIAETAWSAVYDFRNQRQCLKRSRTEIVNQ